MKMQIRMKGEREICKASQGKARQGKARERTNTAYT